MWISKWGWCFPWWSFLFILFVQVNIVASLLHAHLSPSIYESVVSLILHLDILQSRTESGTLKQSSSPNIILDQIETSVFGFSVSASLESASLYIDLANDGENSSVLMFTLQELDYWFVITYYFCAYFPFSCYSQYHTTLLEFYNLMFVSFNLHFLYVG